MEIIDRETAQYIVDTVKSVCGKDINYIDAQGDYYCQHRPQPGRFLS